VKTNETKASLEKNVQTITENIKDKNLKLQTLQEKYEELNEKADDNQKESINDYQVLQKDCSENGIKSYVLSNGISSTDKDLILVDKENQIKNLHDQLYLKEIELKELQIYLKNPKESKNRALALLQDKFSDVRILLRKSNEEYEESLSKFADIVNDLNRKIQLQQEEIEKFRKNELNNNNVQNRAAKDLENKRLKIPTTGTEGLEEQTDFNDNGLDESEENVSRLKIENQSLKKKNQNQLKDYDQRLKISIVRINKLQQSNNQLLKTLEDQKQLNGQLQQKIQAEINEKLYLENNLTNLEIKSNNSINELEKAAGQLEKNLLETSEELTLLKQDYYDRNETFKKELNEVNQINSDLKRELSIVSENYENLQKEFEDSKAEVNNAKLEIKQKEYDYNQYRDDLQIKYDRRISEIQEEKAILEKEFSTYQERAETKMESYLQQLNLLEIKSKSLEERSNSLDAEVEELSVQLAESLDIIKEKDVLYETLENIFERNAAEHEKEITGMKKNLDAAVSLNQKFNKELKEISEEKDSISQEKYNIEQLIKDQNTSYEKKQAELNRMLDDYSQERYELEKNLKVADEELQELRNILNDRDIAIDQYRQELKEKNAEMEGSQKHEAFEDVSEDNKENDNSNNDNSTVVHDLAYKDVFYANCKTVIANFENLLTEYNYMINQNQTQLWSDKIIEIHDLLSEINE